MASQARANPRQDKQSCSTSSRTSRQHTFHALASLKGYNGDLRATLLQAAPATILDDNDITRTYILDGVDEVPPEQRAMLRQQLDQLPVDARIVLTARQAFYTQHKEAFPTGLTSYHLLDFEEKDIRAYAAHRGIDPEDFLAAAREMDVDDLISNPFLLGAMLDFYRDKQGRLGKTRAENVAYAIDRLIQSRQRFNGYEQRRALRMLAIACETAARNQLTNDEAHRVLHEATRFSADDARQLLDELSESILIRSAGGISFQMRSFGEYLAAEELCDKNIDRLFELAFLGTTPIDTWLNTITYLAEMNSDVRRYFSRRHPEWMMTVAPAAFTIPERTTLTSTILDSTKKDETYLVNQEKFSLQRLARLLTPEY